MKKVHATIVYPVDVEISIEDNASPDEIWEAIIKEADGAVASSAPVVYACSELATKKGLEEYTVNSQEDWVNFILQKLHKSKEVLEPVLSALTLLKAKAHPEIIIAAYQSLDQAIQHLVASVSPDIILSDSGDR